MDKQEVAKLLAINKSIYPHSYKGMSETETAALLEVWTLKFAPYPAELIQNAFLQCLEYCQYPVSIANIFEQLRKMQAAGQKTTDELWQEFLQAAAEVGRLATGFHYNAPSRKNPGIDQGTERKQQAREIFAGLSPEIVHYVGSLGRLIAFGEMSRGDLEQRIFPSFRRSVGEYRERDLVLQQTDGRMLEMVQRQKLPDDRILKNGTDYRDIYRVLGGGQE